MDFSERQLEIAKRLSRKEQSRETKAYYELNLSFLCPYCRDFLETEDYSEFVRRRKRWIKGVRGGIVEKGLTVSSGRPRELQVVEELLLLPVFSLGVFGLLFWLARRSYLGILAVMSAATLFIGVLALMSHLENVVHPTRTKIRWTRHRQHAGILVIDVNHIHIELRSRLRV